MVVGLQRQQEEQLQQLRHLALVVGLQHLRQLVLPQLLPFRLVVVVVPLLLLLLVEEERSHSLVEHPLELPQHQP